MNNLIIKTDQTIQRYDFKINFVLKDEMNGLFIYLIGFIHPPQGCNEERSEYGIRSFSRSSMPNRTSSS